MTGIVDFAFTPFSAGLVGGLITGMCALETRWYRFGSFIWFTCWVILYTVVFAFHSDHPMDVIPTALGISGLWGIVPYAITFAPIYFLVERLRPLFVRTKKR